MTAGPRNQGPPGQRPGWMGNRGDGQQSSQRPAIEPKRDVMAVKGKRKVGSPREDSARVNPCEDSVRVRPQVKLVYKGEVIPALIDTGADVNVISKEWADRHMHITRRLSDLALYPAFGKPLEDPEVIDLMVRAEGQKRLSKITFHIAPINKRGLCLITPKSAEMLGVSHLIIPKSVPDDVVSTNQQIPVAISKELRDILEEDQDIFQSQLVRAGQAVSDQVDIIVPSRSQVFVPSRPINHDVLQELYEELDRMLESGVIEPSYARRNSPLIVVRKPNGKLRVCIDLRCLNSKSELFRWDYPRVDLALRRMAPATIFSKLDLTSGFWQMPLSEESRDYTTFRVGGRAWRFTVVPFGWKNSPAVFQAMMDMILSEPVAKGYVTVYMDDTDT